MLDDKTSNSILTDRDYFRKFITENQNTTVKIFRIVMEKKDLLISGKPDFLNMLEEEIPHFIIYTGEKKIEAVVDYVAGDPETRRAGYYNRYLNADIYRRYGLSAYSTDEEYSKVPDTYVIMFSKNDPFGKGRPTYLWVNYLTDSEGNKLEEADDGTYILYVNCAYDADDEYGKLMRDLRSILTA